MEKDNIWFGLARKHVDRAGKYDLALRVLFSD